MPANINDRTEALAVLKSLCEPNAEPALTPDEIEEILDNHLIAAVWEADKTYKLGDHVYPTVRNDHKYIVSVGGTSDTTEPVWLKSRGGKVINGGATFIEDGVEYESGYDVQQAAYEAWNRKCSKASEFISTPGVDMGKIFDRCEKMRDQFEQVVMA